MSKIDQLKVRISFHEKLFFTLVIMILIASWWLASMYSSFDVWLTGCLVSIILITVVLVSMQYRHIKDLIKQLGQVP